MLMPLQECIIQSFSERTNQLSRGMLQYMCLIKIAPIVSNNVGYCPCVWHMYCLRELDFSVCMHAISDSALVMTEKNYVIILLHSLRQ